MSSDKQNEKKNDTQIPSLNEYNSKPWTEWVNKAANVNTILFDKEANSRSSPNVRLLPRKDVNLYGLYPKMDQRVLNECGRCKAIVLPEAFITHSQKVCASEITLIKKKHAAKNKKKKYVTVRVPAPPLFQFPPSYDSKSATTTESDQQQQQKEDGGEQLDSGIEQLTLINDDSNRSNEIGCEGSDGGQANIGSETGPGSAAANQPDHNTTEHGNTTGTATAEVTVTSSITTPPPSSPSSPPPSPPTPPPSTSHRGANTGAITTINVSSTSAPITAITVTIPVIASATTNNTPIIVAAITTPTTSSSTADSTVTTSQYRRHKKSGRSSRSTTLATVASSPTGSNEANKTTQHVDIVIVAGSTIANAPTITIASLNTSTATITTTTSATSLRTKSCDMIASVKPMTLATSPKTTRRSTATSGASALAATPAVSVRIPNLIPAVIPPRHPPTRSAHLVRSVVGAGLSPRIVASVRVRSVTHNRCLLSTLRRSNEQRSFNTSTPSPSHRATATPQQLPRDFLPYCTPTPTYIVPTRPIALFSPLQGSMYKTQQDHHFMLTNTRTANTTYHGHPKPLTLATASTRRLGDTFLLQGQRVDSQLNDIQAYLSKRFTLSTKSLASDLQMQQEQSSPGQQHHSNQHNHHHRPNILKNSNNTSGSPRVLTAAKRPAPVSIKDESSPTSSPSAKLRHTNSCSSSSVAEMNGIILHADVSSESAAEAPSFTLPASVDSGDGGGSPTETINAIQAITVNPDTCDFSELHIFEVSQ